VSTSDAHCPLNCLRRRTLREVLHALWERCCAANDSMFFLPSWSVSPNAYCALLVENKMRAPIIKKPSYQNECRVEVQARSRA
jgi:hypothetical protein